MARGFFTGISDMAISIQRGRQFAVGDSPVFDESGKEGGYLTKAGAKLAAAKTKVQIGTTVLSTAAQWKAFIAANAATSDMTDAFVTKFGITFQDFINVIGDVAASPDKGLTLDLRPTSALAKKLSLNATQDDYAAALKKGATVSIPTAAGTVTATAAGVNTITKAILSTPVAADWQRDRSEQEAWEDFQLGNGASGTFRENTGPEAFAKLYQPKWSDKESMKLVNQFTLPLHLEVDSDPNVGREPSLVIPDPEFPNDRSKDQKIYFQDGYENFRDTYYDDVNGTLASAGASVRARVRFDNKAPDFRQRDVRIQAKEGRVVSGSSSAVHKFEIRSLSDEDAAKQMLVSGQESPTKPLAVAQKLYKLAQDKNVLPDDGNLTLLPKYTVLQKRRRTHLVLDDVGELKVRQEALKKEIDALTAASKPVPAALEAYAEKLDGQVKFLDEANEILRKYGGWFSGWGDCFIVSADRYNVYDASARKEKINDIDDEVGLIGKGPLHVEAEWDSASSDGFEKAGVTIKTQLDAAQAKLTATPAPTAAEKTKLLAEIKELESDATRIEEMRAIFRKDVEATVSIIKDRLVGAGLTRDRAKKSKDERASDIASQPRATYWP